MDESGYYAEGSSPGGDSSGFQDEPVVLVSGGTVECPLEKDGTLLLSTIQGQFAGAGGLSYLPLGSQKKRAVRYDSSNGKLFAPPEGWTGRKFYVSFSPVNYARGFQCLAMTNFDRYEHATKTFEHSVSAVRKLMDSERSLEVESTEESQQKLINKLKQEVATLRQLRGTQSEKESAQSVLPEDLESLIKERDEYAEKALQFEQRLAEKVQELENIYCQKQEVQYAESDVSSHYEHELVTVRNQLNECESRKGDLGNEVHQLQQEVENRQKRIEELEWLKNELEALTNGELDHLRHELHISQERNNLLEQQRNELELHKDGEIDHLRQEIINRQQRIEEVEASTTVNGDLQRSLEEAQSRISSHEEEQQKLKNQLEELRAAQQTAANSYEETINNLRQELEEVRQWFNDSKWRCGELEAEVGEKQGHIEHCSNRIGQLELELNEARVTFEPMQKRVGELEAAIASKEAELRELQEVQSHLSNKEEELQCVKTQFEEMRAGQQSLMYNEEAMANLKEELDQARQSFNDIKWRCGELEAELASRQGENSNKSNHIGYLETELNQARSSLESTQKKN